MIAYNRTIDQIREVIGADSLGYLEIPRLEEIADGLSICKGCFTGKYSDRAAEGRYSRRF